MGSGAGLGWPLVLALPVDSPNLAGQAGRCGAWSKGKKTMPSLNQLALKKNSAVSLAASDGALYIKMVSQGLSLKTDCLITSLQDSLAILANRLG